MLKVLGTVPDDVSISFMIVVSFVTRTSESLRKTAWSGSPLIATGPSKSGLKTDTVPVTKIRNADH
jgi:hypothetical protein